LGERRKVADPSPYIRDKDWCIHSIRITKNKQISNFDEVKRERRDVILFKGVKSEMPNFRFHQKLGLLLRLFVGVETSSSIKKV
jgi:hypothetical protein